MQPLFIIVSKSVRQFPESQELIRVITTLILFITIINISNCNQSNSDFVEWLFNIKISDESNLQRKLPLPKSEIAKFDNINQEVSLTDLEENPVNTPSDVQTGCHSLSP